MKNSKGYEINFAAKEIIITKKFSKAAGIVGSEEYLAMVTLRKDFEDFSIKIKSIEKKENKVSYKGLSIDEMRRFLKNNKEQEDLDPFEKILELQEGKRGKYAIVKKWFLDNYKESYTTELEELTKTAA